MPDRYKTVLLFGPPGVGKGTQGKLLGQIPGMRHVATGDIFRSMDRHSPLGQKVLPFMDRGELVPDDLTMQLWQQYMEGLVKTGSYLPRTHLLILDGIPRSRAQATMLDPFVETLLVLHLSCPDINQMVTRMKGRALKEDRPDDADESVIRHRFAVYDRESRPVLSHYDKSLVKEIEAVGTPAEVLLRILSALVPVYSKRFGNPLNC